jgi:hypothetical protein
VLCGRILAAVGAPQGIDGALAGTGKQQEQRDNPSHGVHYAPKTTDPTGLSVTRGCSSPRRSMPPLPLCDAYRSSGAFARHRSMTQRTGTGIVGIETTDKLTDQQVVAKVKEHYGIDW